MPKNHSNIGSIELKINHQDDPDYPRARSVIELAHDSSDGHTTLSVVHDHRIGKMKISSLGKDYLIDSLDQARLVAEAILNLTDAAQAKIRK